MPKRTLPSGFSEPNKYTPNEWVIINKLTKLHERSHKGELCGNYEMGPPKQTTIKTQNRFGVLDEESLDMDIQSVQEPSTKGKTITQTKKRPPPIVVVSKFENLCQLHQEVKKIVGDNYNIQYSYGKIKIMLETAEQHYNLRKHLHEEDVQFHTYTSKENRTSKIVLKIAPFIGEEEIMDEFQKMVVKITKCIKRLSKRGSTSSFLMYYPKETTMSALTKVTHMLNIKVK